MRKLIAHSVCDRQGTFHGLKAAVEATLKRGAQSLFILGCARNDISAAQWNNYLETLDTTVFGGLFPRIIYGTDCLEQGIVVCGFSEALPVTAIALNQAPPSQWRHTLESDTPWLKQCKSLFVLIDSQSSLVDPFIELLYDQVGASLPIAGGGAGDIDASAQPCILTNQGLLSDCALLIGLPTPLALGVTHGWRHLAGPFLVTESRGNTLYSLNYEPAAKLYKTIIEQHTGHHFCDQDIMTLAKAYPFGIERLDNEILIRDPVAEDKGALTCMGTIPEHAMIHIMQGDRDSLLAAADRAVLAVKGEAPEAPVSQSFLFDCISRALFLGDDFPQEIDHVHRALASRHPLVGALTLGEIASSPWGPVQFLNKSIVVSALREH